MSRKSPVLWRSNESIFMCGLAMFRPVGQAQQSTTIKVNARWGSNQDGHRDAFVVLESGAGGKCPGNGIRVPYHGSPERRALAYYVAGRAVCRDISWITAAGSRRTHEIASTRRSRTSIIVGHSLRWDPRQDSTQGTDQKKIVRTWYSWMNYARSQFDRWPADVPLI